MTNDTRRRLTAGAYLTLLALTSAVGLGLFVIIRGLQTDDVSLLSASVSALIAVVAAVAGFYVSGARGRRFRDRQVFISYDHRDADAARVVAEAVERAGYKPWVGETGLQPGVNIQATIEQAIRASGAVLAIVPPPGNRWVDLELETARGLSATAPAILPIVVDRSRRHDVPDWANGTVWLDLDQPTWRSDLAHFLGRAFLS